MELFANIKIISGGQTGVDRAALDFAITNSIDCGGWCPKGRIAEDGKISTKYPLSETISNHYPERTKLNIKDSDATLILYLDKYDRGTMLTQNLCKKLNKPVWIQNLENPISKYEFKKWLQKNNCKVLNFAGPRESFSPEIYKMTLKFLNKLHSSESF